MLIEWVEWMPNTELYSFMSLVCKMCDLRRFSAFIVEIYGN